MAKYTFELSETERSQLHDLVHRGNAAAHKRLHAQILLLADSAQDQPKQTDREIARVLDVGISTVHRVRQQFVEEGVETALNRRKHKNHRPFKLDGEKEAQLVMLACTEPPEGRQRWTLRLLASRLVELEVVQSISKNTVGRMMKKKRAQAVAEAGVVHCPQSQRRVRVRDGGRA